MENQERANRIYRTAMTEYPATCLEEVLIDVLTDAMHLATHCELVFADLLRIADEHYRVESNSAVEAGDSQL